MDPLAPTESKPPLLTLPNELFFEVASNLESFRDLNSLLRTSRLFHTLFNPRLYHLAVAADDCVREDIVVWVLSEYRVASLTLLLDNGLSVHQKLSHHLAGVRDLLLQVCYSSDHKRSLPLARLLLERGADIAIKDDCSETKLHAAAGRGNSSIAALLLEHGANVNATNEHGRTPLHFVAIFFGGRRPHCEISIAEWGQCQCSRYPGTNTAALDMFQGQLFGDENSVGEWGRGQCNRYVRRNTAAMCR
jgi:hypothetical protein